MISDIWQKGKKRKKIEESLEILKHTHIYIHTYIEGNICMYLYIIYEVMPLNHIWENM